MSFIRGNLKAKIKNIGVQELKQLFYLHQNIYLILIVRSVISQQEDS